MNGSATWLGSGYPRGYLSFLQSPILFLDLFDFSVCCFSLEVLFLIFAGLFANKEILGLLRIDSGQLGRIPFFSRGFEIGNPIKKFGNTNVRLIVLRTAAFLWQLASRHVLGPRSGGTTTGAALGLGQGFRPL